MLTGQGALCRYPPDAYPQGVPAKVLAAVEHELELIDRLEYEPDFLTVAGIVQWARDQRILCQGRGSAANSAVCFCLRATEVNPMTASMLFERFISAERGEPPDSDSDIDIDIDIDIDADIAALCARWQDQHSPADQWSSVRK